MIHIKFQALLSKKKKKNMHHKYVVSCFHDVYKGLHKQTWSILTLKMLATTAADDTLKHLFLFFRENKTWY